MPDIDMRFHTDMLVLSAPFDSALASLGVDPDTDVEMLAVTEPETLLEAMRPEFLAGTPCLVTPTHGITRARLTHFRMEDHAAEIVASVLASVKSFRPQHVLAAIGPTGLPLDATSRTSLKANRDQYADAAALFSRGSVDGYLLDGLVDATDLRCAVMGVRKETDAPVFVSMRFDARGNVADRDDSLEEVIDIIDDMEGDVVGIESAEDVDATAQLVERAVQASDLPVMVTLDVEPGSAYESPDAIMAAAMRLRGAGAQFLRAGKQARAAHSGALWAALMGLDSIR